MSTLETPNSLIYAARAGYAAAIRATSRGKWTAKKQAAAQAEAVKAYPITRPRVIRQGTKLFKVEGGKMFMRDEAVAGNHPFAHWNHLRHATREYHAQLVELWDNPEVVS